MDINILLHNISEDLDSNEIDALKFLCKDHIQRKKMEDVHDGRDLFLKLEEQGLLEDVSIVGELLYTIKRYDLLKVLGTSKKKTQDRLQMQGDSGCLISSYRKLLYEVSEDVSEDNLEAIKFLLKIPQVRSCKTFLDVLIEMEKQELLADNNLENLESLFETCQPELCFRVKEYVARRDVGNTSLTSVAESMVPVSSAHQIVPSFQESPSSAMSPISSEAEMSLFTDTGPRGTPLEKDWYNMTHYPRGYCLIINNYKFEKACQLGNRKGTDKDADSLSSVFSWLHFKVQKYQDLTATEILNTVNQFGKWDHSSKDAFVCCILSHGEKGSVFGTDGKPILIQQITQPFKSSNCPSLAGKPKMFFIQACQGQNKQKGMYIQADGDEGDDRNYSRDTLQIPDDSDFLLGMATVADYQSFRHVRLGSIYIQELCKQLRDGCQRNKNILEILTIVNREVGLRSYPDFKQMPEPRYTLTKTLVLPVD